MKVVALMAKVALPISAYYQKALLRKKVFCHLYLVCMLFFTEVN